MLTKTNSLVFAALLAASAPTFAQLNDGGSIPASQYQSWGLAQSIDIAKPNLAQIIREDEAKEKAGSFERYGRIIPTQINPNTYGQWHILANGDKIWRLRITLEEAKAISLHFDYFKLPQGAKLHVYNDDKSRILGGFGAHNNHKTGFFATAPIAGEAITIEYYHPAYAADGSYFNISGLGYAYKNITRTQREAKEFGDATACHVNVGCTEINGRTQQRDAVARIGVVVGADMGWCSGSMINNTAADGTPYFLTALHCFVNGNNNPGTANDLAQWTFDFNYQSTNCNNPVFEPFANSLTGATLRAHSNDGGGNTGSDFLLIELDNRPPLVYNAFYAGWDRNNTAPSNGYGIHHPSGDIKKISSFSSSVSDSWGGLTNNTHWTLDWVATTNGHSVTMGGSSGSPIFNSSNRITGTLTGGSSDCDGSSYTDTYGKFSYHWSSNGSANNRKLQPWLDPNNTGNTAIDGAYLSDLISVSQTPSAKPLSVFPNPNKGVLFINLPAEIQGEMLITVIDALGRQVQQQLANNNNQIASLDIQQLPNGVYFVNIQAQAQQYSQKIILQK